MNKLEKNYVEKRKKLLIRYYSIFNQRKLINKQFKETKRELDNLDKYLIHGK